MANNEIKMLAMEFDSNFQNFIAKAAHRGNLIRVYDTLSFEHIGYPSGLDEQWLQICTQDDFQIDLINISQIVNISEVKINGEVSKMSEIPSRAKKDKVFRITKSFRIKATGILGFPKTEDWDED